MIFKMATIFIFFSLSVDTSRCKKIFLQIKWIEIKQGCALAVPRGLRLLTFVFGRLEKLIFCIMVEGRAPQIPWLGAFGHPVILLRAQPLKGIFS